MFIFLQKLGQPFNGHNQFSLINNAAVRVKSHQDVQPILLEPAVAHQRLAQLSGTDDNRIIDGVVAKKFSSSFIRSSVT
jgi:hypothetical protein